MREEEMFAFLAVAVLAGGIVWMSLRYHTRRETLKTIQRVVESGTVDEVTRRTLLDALASSSRRNHQLWQWLARNAWPLAQRLLGIVGWLTMVISGTVLGALAATDQLHRYNLMGGIVGVGVGFALITLPMALRECEGRRRAA